MKAQVLQVGEKTWVNYKHVTHVQILDENRFVYHSNGDGERVDYEVIRLYLDVPMNGEFFDQSFVNVETGFENRTLNALNFNYKPKKPWTHYKAILTGVTEELIVE